MGTERTGLLWPWTESERVRLHERYTKGERVLCPTDETPLRVVVRDGQLIIRCLQCGNSSMHEVPKPPTRAPKAR